MEQTQVQNCMHSHDLSTASTPVLMTCLQLLILFLCISVAVSQLASHLLFR